MAADVLLYNALNANRQELNVRLNATNSDLTTVCSCCTTLQNCFNSFLISGIACASNNFGIWCQIPTGSGWTGGFSVCSTLAQFNCGATCTWTVPGGVTCARFQLWGAGAGTGGGCCCSISPWGGTGAYASVVMPVTAGQVYTLCSGCAFCCFARGAQNIADGCPSFVLGTGLNNFCAEGGDANRSCQICRRMGPYPYGCCTMYKSHCVYIAGTDYCFGGGGTGGDGQRCFYNSVNGFYPSAKTFYGTATGGTVYGINGLYGAMRMGVPNPCVIHAPIYGFPTTSCCACCLYNYNQGCCRTAQSGFMCVPGASGWFGYACGGATTRCGDMGRMGMVCVCFK